MRSRHWILATVALVGLVAFGVAAQEIEEGQEQTFEVTGVVNDVFETDDGAEVLELELGDGTILALYIEAATEIWYGDEQVSSDVLWEAIGAEAEVEYTVSESKNVLRKVWLSPFDAEKSSGTPSA
jgi:hypothetical protein